MELNMPATLQDISATTAENGSIPLLDESKVPPLTSTTNDSATQASPQIRGQSQSPISISGSDSAIVSSAVSDSAETPRGSHGGVANSAQDVLPPSSDFASLSTNNVSDGEKVRNNVPENGKGEKKNRDQEKMDVDEPELNGEQNAKQTDKADGESRDSGSVNARDEDADLIDDDSVRLSKIQTIQETLEKMENMRLELLPLLLDIIEQVKNGELSIKDVDNACGRIRVRINRLKDSRNTVESGLQRLVDESNGTEHSQHETEQRIKAKSDAISRLIAAVNARKGTATS
ncbi:hypothetical protein PMKS-000923 [Pichia membranifaciens]|uniref:Mediator of RNA polymerase II transcription subunit 9 n=1 Tax=Pichia membranifaciens TaxID=4926 RepID=A0A1Q2YD60_9ASCO|nr:hypothetical protein PMKS-000923 [Pichia membranifaciens]